MKKFATKVLAVFMVLLTLVSIFPFSSYGASVRYFQTKQDNVILRTGPASSYKDNTITVQYKGTVLKAVSKTTNSSGNVWYKLDNGYWVFSERVTGHTHSYYGGICTGRNCGYEYPLSVKSFSATVVVTNTNGAKVWSRPYSENSTHLRTYEYGTVLKVTAKTTNINSSGKAHNLWLRLEDGSWVYSGNVTRRYTVSYSSNGGSGAPGNQYFLSGNTVTIPSVKPSRVGYTFKGWSTSASSSTVSYKPGDKYSTKSSVKLYAVWAKCSHTYVGGICTKCKYEAPLTVTAYSATMVVTNTDGAKIWSRPYSNNSTHIKTLAKNTKINVIAKTTNIGADGKPDNVWYKLSDGSWVYSGNVTRQLTVKYNANGGKGAPSSQTFLSGKSITISSTKPTRVGYTFKGWSTSSSSSTVSYKPGSKYSEKKSVTLYAVWAKCSHTYSKGICTKCKYEYPLKITNYSGSFTFVVTNSNGAPGWSRPYENTTKNKTYAKNTALSIVAKTTNVDANGKAHNLWYKTSDGNWVYSGNVTQRFTVKYNANGGKGAPAAQSFLSGKSITISSAKPSRVGYTFKGWSTSKNSSKVSYKPGNKYSEKKGVTLYAVWSKCSHTYNGGICTKCKYEYPLKETSYSAVFVVINDNGAPVWSRPYSSNSKKLRFEDYNTKLKVIAKTTNIGTDGKADNVWYKLSDGNWVYSGNVAQQLTVKYNANGGKGAPSSQTFLSGKTLTLSKTKPTKEGYVFKGWATKKDETKATYSAGGKYSEKKNVTLYAVWAKCSHSSYNDKGVCTKCKYDYKEKVDKSVAGTYVVIESKAYIRDIPYEVGSVVKTVNKNRILKVVGKTTNAKNKDWYKLEDGSWIFSDRVKPGFMATYNLNGGEGENFSSGFVTGKLVVTSKIPTRAGYAFMGWATSSKATKATYKTGDTYSVKKNIKLYAVWSKCTTHNYDNNYGICKNCKSEYPLTVTNMDNTVYSVKNTTSTYKRPYEKTGEEKTKNLSKGSLVLVVGKTENEYKHSDNLWYKLNDGSWIKASEVTKQKTYNDINSIPADQYTRLQKGTINAKKITGVWYYTFTYDKKTIYVSVSAFEGQSKNTELSSVNKSLSDDINDNGYTKKKFIYNEKTTSKSTRFDIDLMKNRDFVRSVWKLTLLEVSAGISGSNCIYVRCQNYNCLVLSYSPELISFELPSDIKLSQSVDKKNIRKAPSTASEYVQCLIRSTTTANVYPKFTVSVTPFAENGTAVGWFTDFEMFGKGYGKKTLKLEDYIDLLGCAFSLISDAKDVVTKPSPLSIYKTLKSAWKLSTTASGYTASAAYDSDGKQSLICVDKKTSTAYRSYTMSILSPIKLQEEKDYLESHIYLYELSGKQDINVKLDIK